MNVKFPIQFDNCGRSAKSEYEQHIQELIEQVLFTSPGERVNRITFGCGLLQLVFQPNSPELAATTQYLVQSSLQQWLGELIELKDVRIESHDSILKIQVEYKVRKTLKNEVVQFSKNF